METGAEPMVFAGPVLSHFEFELVGAPRRLTDEEWTQWYQGGERDGQPPPPHPDWTRDYLVSDR